MFRFYRPATYSKCAFVAHRREHASNTLPLPVCRRWSPQASS